MKKLLMLVLALLAMMTLAAAEEPTLWPAYDEATRLWGYIDETGAWAIKPQFGRAYHFHGGCAIVDTQDVPEWEGECTKGVIDETGAYLLAPEYDVYDACCYEGAGLLYFVERENADGEWQSGWFNIPNRFFSGLHWAECYAARDTAYVLVSDDYSVSGLADRMTGEIVLPVAYTYTGLYDWAIEDGYVVAQRDEGPCELVELGVGVVQLPEGVEIAYGEGVSGGWLPFLNECGLYGYLNTAGEIVIPAQYDYAHAFRGGYAEVILAENELTHAVIDRQGQIVLTGISRPWSYGYNGMVDGALFVRWAEGDWGLVETDGTVRCRHALPEGAYDVWLWEFAPDGPIWVEYRLPDEESVYALMTREGALSELRWTWASWNAGEAWLAVSEDCERAGRELVGTWGYVDEYGSEVLPAVYAWAEPFDGALARVRFADGQEGYIDREGKIVYRWTEE